MEDVPRVWELIDCFKEECNLRGWKTSANEDWIKVDGEFHNFLWAKDIHPSTFNRIVTASKCAVRQGMSYQVVQVAYTAWLFPEAPPEILVHTLTRNLDFTQRIAIYDLSNVYAGKPVCLKFNQTNSRVFQEFENFLEKKWGVKFKPSLGLLAEEIQEQFPT
ncbi:MAG: hypothetical protein PVF15_06005 [Candidatus Bathyarchaeota archaeon]|jgi:hypothetical protein